MTHDESARAADPAAGAREGRAPGGTRALNGLAGTLSGWWRSLRAWLARERADIAIVLGLTLAAALLRIPRVGSLPLGLHGDEAWTGLDARRILDEGWIGPYVLSALGQPTGPLYFTAAIFKIFGDSADSIRLSMALLGVAAIPFTYMAFSLMFNRTTALFAALFLLAMTWHLHLSRMGFMVISWPLMEMVVLWALWLAWKRNSLLLYALAGLLLGLGVYTYNAYLLFVPVPFIALAWMLVRRPRDERVVHLAMCGVFASMALVGAASLLNYINENRYDYRAHQKVISVIYTDEWKQGDTRDRIDMLWERAQDWHQGLFFGGHPDTGDGLSTHGHPPVDPLIYGLALGGLAMAAWRWRRPEYIVLLAAVALLPWGAILTILAGMFRRTLGLAPFIAVLAALPLAWLFERLWRRDGRWRIAALALFAIPVVTGARAAYLYFGPTQDTRFFQYVMVQELDAASRYMERLPQGTHIYYYSGRWFIDYETRRYLAPNIEGTDRSQRHIPQPGEAVDYSIGVDGPVAFVFLWPYAPERPDAAGYIPALAEVQARYPGGDVTEHVVDGRLFFQAYYLPLGEPSAVSGQLSEP